MAKNKDNLESEIILDTKKFKKELKNISKELKKFKKELSINKAMKIKVDDSQLKQSTKGVAKLKGDIKGLPKGDVRIDTGGISKAEKQIKSLKAEIKSIPKADLGGAGVGGIGGVPKIGGALMAGGAALGGISAVGLAGMSEDKAQRTFRTRFGGEKVDADLAIQDIQKLALETGKSFGLIAESYLTLKQAGVKDSDLRKSAKISTGVSEAFGLSSEEIARMVKTTTKEFGISGQESLAGLQVLLQEAGNLDGETVDSLYEYAVQQKNLGYSWKESLELSLQGAKAGLWNTDKLFDILKETDVKMGDLQAGVASSGQLESLKKLGLTVSDFEGLSGKEGFEKIKETARESGFEGAELRAIITPLMATMLEDIGGVQKLLEMDEYQVNFADGWIKMTNTRLVDNQFEGLTEVIGKTTVALNMLAGGIFRALSGEAEDEFGGRSAITYKKQTEGGSTINVYATTISAEEIKKIQKEDNARNSNF